MKSSNTLNQNLRSQYATNLYLFTLMYREGLQNHFNLNSKFYVEKCAVRFFFSFPRDRLAKGRLHCRNQLVFSQLFITLCRVIKTTVLGTLSLVIPSTVHNLTTHLAVSHPSLSLGDWSPQPATSTPPSTGTLQIEVNCTQPHDWPPGAWSGLPPRFLGLPGPGTLISLNSPRSLLFPGQTNMLDSGKKRTFQHLMLCYNLQ